MDIATSVQTLDKAVSISHCVNTLGKCMNSIYLPPTMGEY